MTSTLSVLEYGMKKPDFYADLLLAEKELKKASKAAQRAEETAHLAKLGSTLEKLSIAKAKYEKLLALV